jgi:hypothetical protein
VPPGSAARPGTSAPITPQTGKQIFDKGNDVMLSKAAKIVIEMSCRSGTWVHLQCVLNATRAPFSQAAGLSLPKHFVVRKISRTPSWLPRQHKARPA